jgi:hypothetical protein
MTVTSYLDYISNAAYVRDAERTSINTSLSCLQNRLSAYFGTDISQQFVFGSYSRGTILPRIMDQHSDVDYMIVFKDGSLRPQSYLDKLRRFVEAKYARSEIEQSHPTIRLSLNHIHFELVPAVNSIFYGLQIPSKSSGEQLWMGTDPTGFNQKLTEKNQANGNIIKPLVRCVKFWNASNNFIYESYDLEQKIVDFQFSRYGLLSSPDLEKYFLEFMNALSLPWLCAEWKSQKLQRTKNILTNIMQCKSYNPSQAEVELKKLLPDPLPQTSLLAKALLGSRL